MTISNSTLDPGFPFMAYEGESYSLENQDKVADARDRLLRALAVAGENEKLGHETMILQLNGEFEMRAGNLQTAIRYLEQSRTN